ncbi:hypothetical protein CCAN2_1920041 [Capnocytophaga canimorsus]|nr:hypothetical protein CCAN2_1920041 [Capnocytophaga canimorsus]
MVSNSIYRKFMFFINLQGQKNGSNKRIKLDHFVALTYIKYVNCVLLQFFYYL